MPHSDESNIHDERVNIDIETNDGITQTKGIFPRFISRIAAPIFIGLCIISFLYLFIR